MQNHKECTVSYQFCLILNDRVCWPLATVRVAPLYRMCGSVAYLCVAFPHHIAKVCEKLVNFERIFLYEPWVNDCCSNLRAMETAGLWQKLSALEEKAMLEQNRAIQAEVGACLRLRRRLIAWHLIKKNILLMGRFNVSWQDQMLVDHVALDLVLDTHWVQVPHL